jgi:hypothetical protein
MGWDGWKSFFKKSLFKKPFQAKVASEVEKAVAMVEKNTQEGVRNDQNTDCFGNAFELEAAGNGDASLNDGGNTTTTDYGLSDAKILVNAMVNEGLSNTLSKQRGLQTLKAFDVRRYVDTVVRSSLGALFLGATARRSSSKYVHDMVDRTVAQIARPLACKLSSAQLVGSVISTALSNELKRKSCRCFSARVVDNVISEGLANTVCPSTKVANVLVDDVFTNIGLQVEMRDARRRFSINFVVMVAIEALTNLRVERKNLQIQREAINARTRASNEARKRLSFQVVEDATSAVLKNLKWAEMKKAQNALRRHSSCRMVENFISDAVTHVARPQRRTSRQVVKGVISGALTNLREVRRKSMQWIERPAEPVKFVRIEHSQQWLHVSRVEVYDENGENVALLSKGATATSSSTIRKGDNSFPIDGVHRKGWPNGCHTNDGANEWWEVQLQRPTAVQKITVWNRVDTCFDRLAGARIVLKDADEVVVRTPALMFLSDSREPQHFSVGATKTPISGRIRFPTKLGEKPCAAVTVIPTLAAPEIDVRGVSTGMDDQNTDFFDDAAFQLEAAGNGDASLNDGDTETGGFGLEGFEIEETMAGDQSQNPETVLGWEEAPESYSREVDKMLPVSTAIAIDSGAFNGSAQQPHFFSCALILFLLARCKL